MARDYTLQMGEGAKKYTPPHSDRPSFKEGLVEDYIPGTYAPGDTFEYVVGTGSSGMRLSFTVVEEKGHIVLCRDKHDHPHYLDLNRNRIFSLTDDSRCPQCNEFFCKCNQEPETQTMSELVTVRDLADYKDEQVIEAIALFIKTAYKERTGTTRGRDWYFQDFLCEDPSQDEVKMTVADEEIARGLREGTFYLFKCKSGQKGASGVKLKLDDYNGKTTEKVYVTASAIVSECDDQGNEIRSSRGSGRGDSRSDRGGRSDSRRDSRRDDDRRGGREDARDNRRETPREEPRRETRPQSTESRGSAKSNWTGTFEERLAIFARGIDATGTVLGLSQEEVKQKVDVVELVRAVMHTFNDGFIQNMPHFNGEAPKRGSSTAAPTDWREAVNPKSGKKLGELDDAKLNSYEVWCLTKTQDDVSAMDSDNRQFYMGVVAMMADKHHTPETIMLSYLDSLGMNDAFDEHDVVTLLKQAYKVERLQDLKPKDVRHLLTNKGLKEELEKIHAAAGDGGNGDDDIPY